MLKNNINKKKFLKNIHLIMNNKMYRIKLINLKKLH